MLSKATCVLALAAVVLGAAATDLGASQPHYTTISVQDMHCAGCARKIASKLYAVPGVLEVKAHLASNSAYVVPQKQRAPSPRAMWEAVEQAGFQPVKLVGPNGVYTAKPGS